MSDGESAENKPKVEFVLGAHGHEHTGNVKVLETTLLKYLEEHEQGKVVVMLEDTAMDEATSKKIEERSRNGESPTTAYFGVLYDPFKDVAASKFGIFYL